MSWFYYKILLISLGITVGLFLTYQGYKYFMSSVQKRRVYVSQIILHYIENAVASGEIMFHFELKDEQKIRFEIVDVNFEKVAELRNETLPLGSYTHKFNTTTLPNGEYFYCLYGEQQKLMKKFEIRN